MVASSMGVAKSNLSSYDQWLRYVFLCIHLLHSILRCTPPIFQVTTIRKSSITYDGGINKRGTNVQVMNNFFQQLLYEM